MSKALVQAEKMMDTSVFAHVPFLRHYDDYVLDCTDAVFSFHLVQCISKYGLPWTAVPTPTSRCPVRLFATLPDQRAAMATLFEAGKKRLLRQIKFPFIMNAAITEIEETKKPGCGLEAAVEVKNKMCTDSILDTIYAENRMDIFMDGEARIRALGALLNYIPASAFHGLSQLPHLLMVFLCHCPATAVDRCLPFWSRSLSSAHPVSGVLLGLPERESSRHIDPKRGVAMATGETILLGLYIFLRERLFEFQVGPKHTDGLLFTCFDALLRHTEGKIELELPEFKTKEYADVRQRLQKAHVKMAEVLGYLRGVLSRSQAPNQELLKTMRIATARDELARTGHTDMVEPSQRRWDFKYCQPLNVDEVRRLLAVHNCVTQSKEFEELDNRDSKLYFRIDQTTGAAVLSALSSGTAMANIFCVQLADDSKTFVLLGMLPADFYGHARWGSYWSLKQIITDEDMHTPQWNSYAFAPTLCQLWHSPHTEHWFMAVALLRDMVGLAPRGTHMFQQEARRVHEVILPGLLKCLKPLQAATLLPLVLAYDSENDGLQQALNSTVVFTSPVTHEDKGQRQLWYQLTDYLLATTAVEPVLASFRCDAKRAFTNWTIVHPSKCTDSANNPCEPFRLETQFRRVKNSRLSVAECKHAEQQDIWQLFAILEQQSKSEQVLSPVPALGGALHRCVHMYDCPIAVSVSEYTHTEIYADSYFPVREINHRVCDSKLDICDGFIFIRAAFRDFITANHKINLATEALLRFQSPPPPRSYDDPVAPPAGSESKKRKSPPPPHYSPDIDGKPSSPKRGKLTMKQTNTMELAFDFGSSADLPYAR